MERTTGLEPATPNLGKVVLYQLSHVRLQEDNIHGFPRARKPEFEKN